MGSKHILQTTSKRFKGGRQGKPLSIEKNPSRRSRLKKVFYQIRKKKSVCWGRVLIGDLELIRTKGGPKGLARIRHLSNNNGSEGRIFLEGMPLEGKPLRKRKIPDRGTTRRRKLAAVRPCE